jgi:hypothetical protein
MCNTIHMAVIDTEIVMAFFVCRKRVGPKCSVVFTHVFNETIAIHEITSTNAKQQTEREN